MIFNSVEFILFLPIVFLLYWYVFRKLKVQNLFICVVSYVFYGWWDWRFLLLIALTSILSFLSGVYVDKYRNRPKLQKNIVLLNVSINLIILGIFKYFNFFTSNLVELFDLFGIHLDNVTLNVLLPVGISFYTFQALSYTIDVYKSKIEATRDVVAFFAYISFFPQLVAGPIERATNLIPQFLKERKFNYLLATDGMRQIIWGFFKKIVIADTCAIYANMIFESPQNQGSLTLILGAILFTFQIYGDFSGYSDIAIGASKLFGIRLMRNFNIPYFSRDIAEFWRRWHISLTTWFRDYLYIPLGGSRNGLWVSIRNTFIIFLVSGFWHGANWTYVVWGGYHACLFLPLLLLRKNRKYTNVIAENKYLPCLREAVGMLFTFVLVVIGWVIFRAETLSDACIYLTKICTNGDIPFHSEGKNILPMIGVMLLIEWWNRDKEHALQIEGKIPYSIARYAIYMVLSIVVFQYSGSNIDFIYFQF